MAKDVIITPASGKLDFYGTAGGSVLANINLTDNNDLSLSTTSGNLIIGDASRDVYIGDGTNEVDIVFEQNGEIRSVAGKYITVNAGTVNATGVAVNTSSPTAVMHVYGSTPSGTVLNVEGTNGSLFSVVDNLDGTLMSVNNNAGLPVLEVFSDDKIVGGRFGQNDFVVSSSGNVGIGLANPSTKLEVSGTIKATNFSGVGTSLTAGYAQNIVGEDGGGYSASVLPPGGAIPYISEIGTTVFRTIGSANQVLKSNGDNPVWGSVQYSEIGGTVPTWNQNTTGTAANITATSNTTLTTLSNLVSIGTITTGVWSASTIGVNKGGTGATTFTTGEVLVGNGTGAVSTLSRSGIDSRSTFPPSAHNQAESTITFTDITTGNASTSAHGYLPKLGGGTTNYLRADGSWATPPDTNTTYSGSTSIILTGGSFQRAALTGDVTAAQNNNGTTIANNAVTNAKAADMAVNTIKGRITSGTGDPEDLTAANVRSIINVENGAQVNTVTSVAGKTGAVTLDNNDVGLGNVANVAALPLAGGTLIGNLVSTSAGSSAAPQLYLNGANQNRIEFNTNGIGGPSIFTISVGTKIRLYPSLATNSATDFAIGLANDGAGAPTRFWQSVSDSNSRFEWFAGSTTIGTLTGAGVLTVAGSTSQINVDNLRLDGNTLSSTNSNGNIILTPNGGGGIAGGASATVTGSYSVVSGGSSNTASCYYSTVGGGYYNTSSGLSSTIGGGYVNTSSGYYSIVGGGRDNTASGYGSTISGGSFNASCGSRSTISGGSYNIASGNYSSISGGYYNITNARHSTINGGHRNIIQSPTNECCSRGATIGGGVGHNTAGGTVCSITGDISGAITCCNAGAFSTIGGGLRNIATGLCSTVGGGTDNISSGPFSVVGGGSGNLSSGSGSTVSGGQTVYACGLWSTGGGGRLNTVCGNYATVSGGRSNNTYSSYAAIGGGGFNYVCGGNYSTVSGGSVNAAIGAYVTIGGGRCNTVSANYGVINGGSINKICSGATASVITGGVSNIINTGAMCSSILGGDNNVIVANTLLSSIQSGRCNTISGTYNTISGGYGNSASGYFNSIIGGSFHCTASLYSCYSAIIAGYSNTTCSLYNVIIGGAGNTTSGYYTTIINSSSSFATCNYSTIIGNSITSDRECTLFVNNLSIKNIPTSAAGLPAGSVFSCAGVLRIV